MDLIPEYMLEPTYGQTNKLKYNRKEDSQNENPLLVP